MFNASQLKRLEKVISDFFASGHILDNDCPNALDKARSNWSEMDGGQAVHDHLGLGAIKSVVQGIRGSGFSRDHRG